ncbi:hypothetical protein LCGC14_0344960 [marine sediment metagenome]|uniref:AP2/ERF domain-containing protein n=1 Tax=marine sediment metagenome TaxID=412755 RepID=A0A0F9TCQ0_9ZZZZ
MREIELTKGYVVKVDDEDYDWLMTYSWHALESSNEIKRRRLRDRVVARAAVRVNLPNGRYAYEVVYMHRLIMKAKPKEQVDHKNHDTLDNRRENLRIVTNQQNSWNSRGAKSFNGKPTSSRFKGVYRKVCKYKGEPKYKYWVSKIRVNGKEITLGHFKTEVEAACYYDMAAHKHFGEHAYLNFDGAAYDKWYNDNYVTQSCEAS